MRFLSAAFWLVLLTVGCLSQTSSNSPAVEVIQKKWEIQIRNPRLDEDPLRASKDTAREINDRRETLQEEAIRIERGLPSAPPRRSARQPRASLAPIMTSYIYKVKFKNTGNKAIRTLVWEYVFFDPETKAEVGRRRFESKVNIAPGKIKTVTRRSGSPPTATINVAQAGKNPTEQYAEQIIVQRIQYSDGSIWKEPVAYKKN
jgi:hypothetical protein